MSGQEPARGALEAVLASKLLHAWAQNRQQVLVPLTLNLSAMEPRPRDLLLAMLDAALAARPRPEGLAERRLAALRRLGLPEAPAGSPPHLFNLLAELTEARLGAAAYAVAALVLDRRDPTEAAFLDWVGAQLGVPPALIAQLARRFRR